MVKAENLTDNGQIINAEMKKGLQQRPNGIELKVGSVNFRFCYSLNSFSSKSLLN